MRRALDRLYLFAGYAAALCMVGTLAMVLLGIVSRLLHFQVPGTDAYAGYCMAGAGFLALAHTLGHGEHIRVGLVLDHAGPRLKHALELWSLVAGLALALLLAWFSLRLTWMSWELHDISTGTDATPLWIPQLSMALGTVVLAIALADALLRYLAGERHGPAQTQHHE